MNAIFLLITQRSEVGVAPAMQPAPGPWPLLGSSAGRSSAGEAEAAEAEADGGAANRRGSTSKQRRSLAEATVDMLPIPQISGFDARPPADQRGSSRVSNVVSFLSALGGGHPP